MNTLPQTTKATPTIFDNNINDDNANQNEQKNAFFFSDPKRSNNKKYINPDMIC